MSEAIDVSHTIIPKSDQLNADQLLNGPLTITVTKVTVGGGDEQPVSIFYDGDKGRPYKPCKTMRKLLVYAWGGNAATWVGKAMTLFNEPDVKFGGELVGGIRISYLSDIESDIRVSLTTTRGKKAATSVKRMDRPATVDHIGLINAAATMDELKAAFTAATNSTKDRDLRAQFVAAKDARKAALSAGDATTSTTSAGQSEQQEEQQSILDQARALLDQGERDLAVDMARGLTDAALRAEWERELNVELGSGK